MTNKEIVSKQLEEYRAYTRDFLFKAFTPVAIVDTSSVGNIDIDNEFNDLPNGTVLYALINHGKK
jgi:hypothetical protein